MCNTLKQDDGLLKRDDALKKDGQDGSTQNQDDKMNLLQRDGVCTEK
jgi:hypothetical protein